MEKNNIIKDRKIRAIDDDSPYSMSTKAAFSAGMLLLTPLTLGLAFYAVYKYPVLLPLVFIALIPAGLSCIGIAGLRRLFTRAKHDGCKPINQ